MSKVGGVFKGCSKIIVLNDNTVVLEKSNDWYRIPFYPEKNQNDKSDLVVKIETKDDVDYYVNVFIVKGEEKDYEDGDKYFKVSYDKLKATSFEGNKLIDDKVISISGIAILEEYKKLI